MALGFLLLIPVAMVLRRGGGEGTISTGGLPGAAAVLQVGGSATTTSTPPQPTPVAALVPPDQAAIIAAQAAPVTSPLTFPPTAAPAPAAALVLPTAPPTAAPLAPPAVAPAAPAPSGKSAAPDSTLAPAPPIVETVPPSPARVAKNPTCANPYEVVGGDYWVGIAKSFKVSLQDMLDANGAGTATAIYPGDELCVPANATRPSPKPRPTTTEAPPQTTKAPATTKPPTTPTKPPTASTKPPTATTKPAPATTAAPPPRRKYSEDEVKDIIRAVWPDDLEDKAIVIAGRESGYSPTDKNYCCYGLFQLYWDVHKSWMKAAGIGSADELFDPQVNAYAAYLLYQRSGGWGPWSQTNY